MSAPTSEAQVSAFLTWEELSPTMQRWLLRAVPMRGNGRHLDANTPLGTAVALWDRGLCEEKSKWSDLTPEGIFVRHVGHLATQDAEAVTEGPRS